jgi:putative transposase
LKARVALEAIKGIKTMSELSAEYRIHPNVITKWKKQLIEGAATVFSRGNENGNSEEVLTRPLYEEIGRLKVELDWLKKKL